MKNKKDSKTIKKNKISEDEYENISWDLEASARMSSEIQTARAKMNKKPTSIALDPSTIEYLRKIADRKGIPYQVLMRSYVLEGLRKDLKDLE